MINKLAPYGTEGRLEGLLTLTMDRVILHRPLSTCQISLKSKELIAGGWTDRQTDIWDLLY